MITIRPLSAADAPAFRAIRLRTFTDHPDLFGTSVEDWTAKSLDEITAQFADPHRLGNVIFGAFDGEQLVAHVGLQREPRPKRRHKAKLFAMYVAPEVRGRGVGKLLIEQLLAHARSLPGVAKVELSVIAHNAPALALYRRFGFRQFGLLEDALRVEGRSYSEAFLELPL